MDYSDIVPSNTFFDLDAQTTMPSTLKFGLFVKTHKMKQLETSLKHIVLLPKEERDSWLHEHEDLMNELLENFVQDSTLALDGLQLDSEATELSIEFVTTLRDVMNTLRGILEDAKSLNS